MLRTSVVQQQSAKRPHMSRVDEYQILNGHYVRLRQSKATIDTKTPHSVHTQAALRGQKSPASKQASKSKPQSPAPSRRSQSLEIKRTSSELTITRVNERAASPTNLKNNFFKPMSMMEIRRIQLSQSATTLRPKRTTTTTSMNAYRQSAILSKSFNLTKSFNYGPYIRGRTLSNQYERRFLDQDIIDKDFHLFNQPSKPNNPRVLLFNLQQSKISKMRVYNPPMGRKARQNLTTTWHGKEFDNNDMIDQLNESGRFLNQRERLTPNAFNVPTLRRPSHLYSQSTKPSLSQNEMEEIMSWNFLRDVTERLIEAQTYSDTALHQLFQTSMNNWKQKLSEAKMKGLLSKLLDDLNIPKEGALSIYQEPKEFVKPALEEPENYNYTDDGDEFDDEKSKSVQITTDNDDDEEGSVQEKTTTESRKSDMKKSSSNKTKSKQTFKEKPKKNEQKKQKKQKSPIVSEPSESDVEEVEEELAKTEEEIVKKNSNKKETKWLSDNSEHHSTVVQPYEESIADDESLAPTPIVGISLKDQVSRSDTGLEQDKSSEATMGEVSDIEEDDRSLSPEPVKVSKNKNNKTIIKKPDEITSTVANTISNAEKRRKYSWESSESEKVPIKDEISAGIKTREPTATVSRKSAVIHQDAVPISTKVEEATNVGMNREDTMMSANESFSQSKPKERRRWWSTTKENSLAGLNEDQIADQMTSMNSGAVQEELRKKREPFLQRLAESTDVNKISEAPQSPELIKPPIPKKRTSLSSSRGSRGTVDKNHLEDSHENVEMSKFKEDVSPNEKPTKQISHIDDEDTDEDDGVFDVPEDDNLRGDYGGRRLSQIMSQLSKDHDEHTEIQRKVAAASAVRSTTVSASSDDGLVDQRLNENRRRSNDVHSSKPAHQETIEEGVEPISHAESKVVPIRHSNKQNSKDAVDEGDKIENDISNENSSSSELKMTKTGAVLKTALNTLALEATSDESDEK